VCMVPGEEEPEFSLQNGNYIEKVMFLAVVGRPWKLKPGDPVGTVYPTDSGWYFEGKVGLFPIVNYGRMSPRNSANAGNRSFTTVNVNRQIFERFMIDSVLPAIVQFCPPEMLEERIYLQLDNASPHAIDLAADGDFYSTAEQMDLDVEVFYQPSQSPDLNICDLSFFNSIQTQYYETPGDKDRYRLVAAVLETWRRYDPKLLNYAFLTLFTNYNKIIEFRGSNKFRITHIGKERLDRLGLLPTVILVIYFVQDAMVVPPLDLLDDGDDDDADENMDDLYDMDENLEEG
jgi:hypothetical protein